MKITSKGIVNGIILDKYGKHGEGVSLPFKIEDYPSNTVCFALIMEDYDAIPVCGFDFLHWAVVNFTQDEFADNESKTNKSLIQGINSRYKALGIEAAHGWTGCAPPDKEHEYELHVFALDSKLDIKDGFFINELHHKLEGHILEEAVIKGIYRK